MPYKIGKKTKTKGWTIMENKRGSWLVIGHSNTRKKAQSSIKAREAGKHNPNWR